MEDKTKIFVEDLHKVSSCNWCNVLVAHPNIHIDRECKVIYKRQCSTQILVPLSENCCIHLLQCDSVDKDIILLPPVNQVPAITLNLNRIIDKSLNHVVKESKNWHEFHLNDSGKKRSFVLNFQKGKEFDDFNEKLEEVIKLLHACRKGKSIVDKKYYLVGFKEEKSDETIEETYVGKENTQSSTSVSSDDSEKSTNEVSDSNLLAPPFSPGPYAGLHHTLPPTSRVTGLQEVINQGLTSRSKSERKPNYHEKIYGSLQIPASVHSILNTEDDPQSICLLNTIDDPAWTVNLNHGSSDIDGNETIKNQPNNSSNTEESWDFPHSIDITEIDANSDTTDFLQTLNIQDIDNSDLLQTLNIQDIDNSDLLKTLNIRDIDNRNLLQTLNIRDIDNSDLIQSLNIGDINNSDLLQTFIIKDIDKKRTLTSRDCVQSVNITDIWDDDDDDDDDDDEYEPDTVNGDDTQDIEMKARQEQNQLKQYAQLLQAAINDGDQENARQYADILAASHVKVAITVDENSLKVEANDQDIKIRVFIEDKETMGGSLLLSVKLTDTIGDLKAKMFFKHKFPIEVQKWIVGKRIPKDDETLQRLRVTNNLSVYLYLVSAKSVGLDKQQHFAASGYTEMTINEKGVPQTAPMSTHHTPQPLNQLSPAPPTQPRVDKVEPTRAAAAVLKAPTENNVQVPKETAVRQEPEGSHNPKKKQVTDAKQIGWQCPVCTFLNLPTRPGCEMCSHPRPKEYKVPENYQMSKEEIERIKREEEDERKAQQLEQKRQKLEAEQSQKNFQQLLRTDNQHLIPNTDGFECPICFDRINPGEGVVLRECLHSFCRGCLKGAIQHNEEAYLRCPFQDASYACNASLQDREIKALVPEELYERYLQKSLSTAESQEMNSFHCKSPDCQGWCIYEDHVNFFKCPVCKKENCLTCKAIHEGVNCQKYQDDLQAHANNNAAARRTQQMLHDMVKKGDAMHCPQCKVILQKKDGCDWIKCSICKTEICWVTKGPRWGPLGPGDISAGCKCRVNGATCHPDCNNCH